MKLTENDFRSVNFGITMAEVDKDRFIYQEPSAFDKKRAAQNNPVLFINKEQYDVKDFKEALAKSNDYLKQ
jgi:hypothetical protein